MYVQCFVADIGLFVSCYFARQCSCYDCDWTALRLPYDSHSAHWSHTTVASQL